MVSMLSLKRKNRVNIYIFYQILVPLVGLILLFLLFRNSYQQHNKKIVDTLAVIFSFFIFLTYLFFFDKFVQRVFHIPFPKFFVIIIALSALAFLLGGIISKIYFSKYYARIIILIGIVLHILLALFSIFNSFTNIEFTLRYMFIDWVLVSLWNITVITFWCRYLLFMQLPTIKFSLVSKDDPKDW